MKAHKTISDIIRIILGLLITAVGYHVYLMPSNISVGGMTGAAVLINKLLHLPYSATLVLLNAALFVWGFKVRGGAYIIRTGAATIALGGLLDLPVPFLESLPPCSPIEALVLGSLLTGVGYGLIISADTSTGGSDLLAAIVTSHWKFLTIGMAMNLLDFAVVTAGAFIDGISTLLPSIVAVLICNVSIDVVAYGFGTDELPAWLSHILPGKSRRRKQPSRRIFRYFPYAAVMASVIIVVVRTYVINGIFQASIL